MHQLRRAPSQEEMEHEPHAQGKRCHPPGPVQRLLKHQCTSFRLVLLEIVGQEQAARTRGTQFIMLTTHQDAGVTEQFFAVGPDRHSGATFANVCCLRWTIWVLMVFLLFWD